MDRYVLSLFSSAGIGELGIKAYAGNVLCADIGGKPAFANGRNEKQAVPNVQNYVE